MSWSIVSILQLHPIDFAVLTACGRWCACGGGCCDVCGSRCLLSLQDGPTILCPVRASDGQLYELSALCAYARYLARSNGTLCVLPGQVIREITFCRAPLFGVSSALASWLRAAKACVNNLTRRPTPSLLSEHNHRLPSKSMARSMTTTAEVAPFPPRRWRHRVHPFPRVLTQFAPCAVGALAAGWPTARRPDLRVEQTETKDPNPALRAPMWCHKDSVRTACTHSMQSRRKRKRGEW